MKKTIIKFGDVIAIPLDHESYGFGQCVTPYNKKSGGFMIAIFSFKSNNLTEFEIDKAIESELLFLGYTFDAKIYHNHWYIIGNRINNILNIKMPYFKIGTPPNDIYLTDYLGNSLGKINEYEFNELSYLTEIAPVRYENAIKAYFGLQEWKDDYDKLYYKKTLESNRVAEKILEKKRWWQL